LKPTVCIRLVRYPLPSSFHGGDLHGPGSKPHQPSCIRPTDHPGRQNQPGIEIQRTTALDSIILIPSFLTTDVFKK
jgi:hypothetical protein